MNYGAGSNNGCAKIAAPKARNVIAQGNALGESWYISLKALKARDNYRRLNSNIIARLQRSGASLAPTWADGPGFCISRPWR